MKEVKSLRYSAAKTYLTSLPPGIYESFEDAINNINNLKTRPVFTKINSFYTIQKMIMQDHKDRGRINIDNLRQDLIDSTRDYGLLMKNIIEYDITYITHNKVETDHGMLNENVSLGNLTKQEVLDFNEEMVEVTVKYITKNLAKFIRERGEKYVINNISFGDFYNDIYVYPQYDGDIEKCKDILYLSSSRYDKYFFEIKNVTIGSYISFQKTTNAGGDDDIYSFIYDNIKQVLKKFDSITTFLRDYVDEGDGDFHIIYGYYEITKHG